MTEKKAAVFEKTYFRKSAERYLDMESLSIGGTYLAGNLIRMMDGIDA